MRGLLRGCRPDLWAIVVILACVVFPPTGGSAGEVAGETAGVTLPEHLTKPEVRDLMSRLSDDQVRALLLEQLDKLAAAEAVAGNDDGASAFATSLATLHRRLAGMWAALPELPYLGTFIIGKLTAERPGSYLWSVLLLMAIVFLGAGVVEWLFRRLFTHLG